MADPFIEERIVGNPRYGAAFTEHFAVEKVKTAGGREYPRIIHPYPERSFDLSYIREHQSLWDQMIDLYHRLYGTFGGFRFRHPYEFSTNGRTGAPTAIDQELAPLGGLVYQLQKTYGAGRTPLAIGLPVRVLFKPVDGTVKVAISGVAITNTGSTRWTVDVSNGRVTFAADKVKAITNITQANQAVVDVGAHSFVVNDVVRISDVLGMVQINLLRATVVAVGATTITLDLNSSAFSAYSSGGMVHTAPQEGESVTGGCEFDFPVRFDTDLTASHAYPTISEVSQIVLREMISL